MIRVGIGLPNVIAGADRRVLADWAREADTAGFASVGVVDRLNYDVCEPLLALAAAAAVTERIALLTNVLIGPIRPTALLVKQVCSLHDLSGGRVTLGIGLGGRADDYAAAGLETRGRGTRLGEQLDALRASPRGEDLRILIGGNTDHAIPRIVRWADGWSMTLGTPEQLAAGRSAVEDAWRAAGRSGRPTVQALCYFSFGPDAERNARSSLEDYYGWLGPERASMIAGTAALDPKAFQARVRAFEAAGADAIVAMPCDHNIDQLERLASAAAPWLNGA